MLGQKRDVIDPFAQIPVAYFERDDLHLDSHIRFMNTDEFRSLPPQAQQSFMRHVAEHEANDAQKQQAFTSQEQAMQGGPPPPPQLEAGGPQMASPMDGGQPFYGNSHDLESAETFTPQDAVAERDMVTATLGG